MGDLSKSRGLLTDRERKIIIADLTMKERIGKATDDEARSKYRKKLKLEPRNQRWNWATQRLMDTIGDWNLIFDMMATGDDKKLNPTILDAMLEENWCTTDGKSRRRGGVLEHRYDLLSKFIIKSVPTKHLPELLAHVMRPRDKRTRMLVDPAAMWRAAALEVIEGCTFENFGDDGPKLEKERQRIAGDLQKLLDDPRLPKVSGFNEKEPTFPLNRDERRVDYSSRMFGRMDPTTGKRFKKTYAWLKGQTDDEPYRGCWSYTLERRKSYDGSTNVRYEWEFNVPALFLIALKDGLIKWIKMGPDGVPDRWDRSPKPVKTWEDVAKEIAMRFVADKRGEKVVVLSRQTIRRFVDGMEIESKTRFERGIVYLGKDGSRMLRYLDKPEENSCTDPEYVREQEAKIIKIIEDKVNYKEDFRDGSGRAESVEIRNDLVDFVLCQDVLNKPKVNAQEGTELGPLSRLRMDHTRPGLLEGIDVLRGMGSTSAINTEVEKMFKKGLLKRSGESMELTKAGRLMAQLLSSESVGGVDDTILKFDLTMGWKERRKNGCRDDGWKDGRTKKMSRGSGKYIKSVSKK